MSSQIPSATLGIWRRPIAINPYAAIFYAENISGGSSDQITATASKTGAFPIITAVEYSGLAASGSLDVTASGNAAGASYASPSVKTTQAGDLLFAVHHTNGSATAIFTPASPWTTVELQSDGSNHEHQTQDQTAAAAGSYVSNGTLPKSLTVQSVIAAFKAGSRSTAPPFPPLPRISPLRPSRQAKLSFPGARPATSAWQATEYSGRARRSRLPPRHRMPMLVWPPPQHIAIPWLPMAPQGTPRRSPRQRALRRKLRVLRLRAFLPHGSAGPSTVAAPRPRVSFSLSSRFHRDGEI